MLIVLYFLLWFPNFPVLLYKLKFWYMINFMFFLYFKNIELKNKKSRIQRKKDRQLHWEENVFNIYDYNYMIKYLLLGIMLVIIIILIVLPKKYIIDTPRDTIIYFFGRIINIIIIIKIIEVIIIKIVLLTIITLPCNYSYKY